MEYYYKLGVLIVDGCPKPLRELFMQEAKADKHHTYTTLSDFLLYHKLLIKQRVRFESQRDLLYPPGSGTVDPTKWDVSLLCTLVQALFPSLPWKVISGTLKMQNVRNAFQHMSATDIIIAAEFVSMWADLDSAIMAITDHLVDASYKQTMTDFIQNLKDRPLPPIGFDKILARLNELKSASSEVQIAAEESHKILKRTASISVKPSGKTGKRFRVEDSRLRHMKGLMASTMKNSLPDDFDPPKETSEIERKLKEDHRVVICGHDSSLSLQTALSVVKKMKYNLDRSVIMKKPSDWSQICHEDVDLTIYIDPFGSPSGFRKNIAEKSVDVFTQMVDISKEQDDDLRIDSIIVTDIKLLQKFKQNRDHEMTADTAVCAVGTTLEPEDLSDDEDHECGTPSCVLCSLLEQSQSYVDYWNRVYDKEEDLRKAKRLLEEEHIICITGTHSSNRYILAANLLSESSRRCLVLRSPINMDQVKTKYLSYLLIKNFGGERKFDPTVAQGWYSLFDILFPMVQQRRIRVVLTCESSILEECIRQLGRHDILDEKYIVRLEQPQAVDVRPGTSSTDPGSNKDKPPSRWRGQPTGTRRIRSASIRCPTDEKGCNICGISMIGDDKFIMADWSNNNVKLYDSDFTFLESVKLDGFPSGLCVSGSTVYVTLNHPSSIVPIQFSSSPPYLTRMVVWPLDGVLCDGITVCDGKLVVSIFQNSFLWGEPGELRVLNMNGNVEKKIDMPGMYGALTSITDSPTVVMADRLGTGRVVSVDILTEKVDVITVIDGKSLIGVTSDEDGNIYVRDDGGSVHFVSVDGQIRTEIKSGDDEKSWNPRGICYIRGKDQLLLQDHNEIVLFEIQTLYRREMVSNSM